MNHTRKSLKNISPSESSSPVKTARNSVMYDKMINLKSKLANFNNNSSNLVKPGAISNKKALNNTCIVSSPSVYEMTEETNYRNFNNDKANRWENTSNNSSTSSGVTKSSNQPIMSKINELKKKWNEVSSKNKNLNTTTYSPHRNDINKSIDDSMTFSNANNADIRLLEEKRLMAIKLKNQSGKR